MIVVIHSNRTVILVVDSKEQISCPDNWCSTALNKLLVFYIPMTDNGVEAVAFSILIFTETVGV